MEFERAQFSLTATDTDGQQVVPINEIGVWLMNFTSQRTRLAYRAAVSEFVDFTGARSVADLTRISRAHVIAWREKLIAAGASSRTVNARLAAISSLYAHLLELQLVAASPTLGVKRPKVGRDKVEAAVLTRAEVRAMLDAPDTSTLIGLRDRALLHVYFLTGCRVSEPCGLRVRDYRWEQGCRVLDFTVKGGKRNRVGIHDAVAAAIDAYLAEAGHGGDGDAVLFQPTKGEGPQARLHRNTAAQIFARYAAAASLPPEITPHAARATFITESLNRGCPLEDVQATVGHAHSSTTQSYDKRKYDPRRSASHLLNF